MDTGGIGYISIQNICMVNLEELDTLRIADNYV